MERRNFEWNSHDGLPGDPCPSDDQSHDRRQHDADAGPRNDSQDARRGLHRQRTHGSSDRRRNSEKPIVFTSIHDDTVGGDSNNNLDGSLPGPGQWESIYLHNSNTSFNHVEIRYAGNVNNPGNTFGPYRVAGLHVSNQSSPTIRNTRIRHSENVGLAILDKTGPILDGLRIENSGQEAIYQVLTSTAIYSGVQLLNNFADRVTLTGGTIATSRTLDLIDSRFT